MVKYVDHNKVELSGIMLLSVLIGIFIIIKLITDSWKHWLTGKKQRNS